MKTKLIIAMLAILAALWAVPGFAQTTNVKGRVLDAEGKPVAGATVEFSSPETGRRYTLKTDSKGQYFSIGISGGTYTVKVSKDGQLLAPPTINFPVSLSKEENVLDFDLAKEKTRAEQQLSPEEKAKREAIAKENQKIAGLNSMLAAASQAIEAGNYDEAVNIMTKATETDPTRDLLWFRLGEAHLAAAKHIPPTERDKAKEHYAQAVTAYKKAIEIKPTVGAYYNNMGEAQAKLGATQDAIQSYTAAAQNDPAGAGKYFFNLGAVLTNTGKVDEANAAFDKAIAADPNYAEAYYQKAVNLMGKATVDPKTNTMTAPPEVATNLNKYLELSPTGPNAEPAKQLLASLGAKVETSFGKGKPAKKSK
ncbi:MAG: tetratricopeptide repeat protein [Terriglobales bacterium]